MKILFISRLYLPHNGGVENHIRGIIPHFQKMGFKVSILTEQFDKSLPINETLDEVEVIRLPLSRTKTKFKLWLSMLNKREWILSHDVIHIHDVFWWFVPLLPSKRFYITFHGYEGSGLPRKKEVLQRKIADLASRGSICVGDYISKWYYANPKIVTYGASIHKALSQSRDLNFVYFGRYEKDTGILTYILMFEKLSVTRSKVNLDVYGSGVLLNKLVNLSRENKSMRVHKWSEDVNSILLKARYVCASQYLSILEAMQAKRLVFAVYNNEIKKDYLMCHPMSKNMIIAGSAQELADKFNNLTDEEENIMVERAYQWAKRQTWEKLADQYLSLWGQKTNSQS